ncbi:FAD-dependent oxidoreductase [Streptomyces kaempferi]|uniref:FAD-dependent oxidoreductase n=1 Tax=Streptomyces kaempferi TaxID=333725 RepID=A0ABW3XC96_9ACTN
MSTCGSGNIHEIHKGSNAPIRPAASTGRIVRPDDLDYAEASLGWDELFVHYPLVIVYAQRTQDVVNALTWARQHDVALRVRSGGHSLEGWSNVDNGIVIDVSELKSAHIDTAARAQAWIAEFSQALRPYVHGAYVNVPNVGMQDWETAYWDGNFDRLRKIKAKYDPRNVFQYEQSVPPAFC